jgi:hypothetical protein
MLGRDLLAICYQVRPISCADNVGAGVPPVEQLNAGLVTYKFRPSEDARAYIKSPSKCVVYPADSGFEK